MYAIAPSVAVIPGPPIPAVPLDVAATLAPIGIALHVLAFLAAIIVLVVRDGRRRGERRVASTRAYEAPDLAAVGT